MALHDIIWFSIVTAFLVKLDTLCRTMKMTRNAASLASLACTCLRLPGNALLKIFKPSTKETRDVRVVFCVVLVSKGLTLAPVGPGAIQESRAEVSTVMMPRGTVPHDALSV